MSPSVSIILPTYNRAHLIPRAIASVSAQTFADWELIVVDDGSTDDTRALLESYSAQMGERIRIIRQPHVGPCAARNRGIDESRGRFLCFLDSDDEFLPGRLARPLELFDIRPELGFVYSDSACIDGRGVRHESVLKDYAPHARCVPSQQIAPGLRVCGPGLFDTLLGEYFISTISGMVRREVLGNAIRFQPDPAYAEEWLFYLKVVRRCRSGFVDEPLCLHHHTPGSLARTSAHRNTLGRRQTLRLILESFPDLPRHLRRVVHRNLARVCDQLGFDLARQGDMDAAGRFWLESCRHRWSVTGLIRALRALVTAQVRPRRQRLTSTEIRGIKQTLEDHVEQFTNPRSQPACTITDPTRAMNVQQSRRANDPGLISTTADEVALP